MSATSLGMAAFIGAIFALEGAVQGFVLSGFFVVVAVAAFLINFVGLPRWAEEREQQMEHLGRHAQTLIREADDGV